MGRDIHYNSVLEGRLRSFVDLNDIAGLCNYLDGLSNAQFRTSGYILGEVICLDVSEEAFWQLFYNLVSYNSKAFLITILKSLQERLQKGDVSLKDNGFSALCQILNPIDIKKLLDFLLPLMKDDTEVNYLLEICNITDAAFRISLLIKVDTLPAAYVLFSTLRYIEHDRTLLLKIARFLIKQSTPLSFNLASLIKVYFGLEEVQGTFSLQLLPYELARIEASYDAFRMKMK